MRVVSMMQKIKDVSSLHLSDYEKKFNDQIISISWKQHHENMMMMMHYTWWIQVSFHFVSNSIQFDLISVFFKRIMRI